MRGPTPNRRRPSHRPASSPLGASMQGSPHAFSLPVPRPGHEDPCRVWKTSGPSTGSRGMSEASTPDDAVRRRAFAEVVEPEIEVMLRVARSITGSSADAEDLVQESLVRAFRAIDRFDGRHPRAWLLTILRNTNANMHRRRRPIAVDDWELIHASRPAFGSAESPAAEEVYVVEELDGALQAAVAQLDPKFRSALVLVDVHDLSYAEAAAVLDVPVGTVMSRLSRARERVRKTLGPTFTTTPREQS